MAQPPSGWLLLDDLDVVLAVHLGHEPLQQAVHEARVEELVAGVVAPALEGIEVRKPNGAAATGQVGGVSTLGVSLRLPTRRLAVA